MIKLQLYCHANLFGQGGILKYNSVSGISVLSPVAPVILVMRSIFLCHVLYKAYSPSCCRPMQKLHLESQKSKVYCELGVIVHVPVCSTVVKEEFSDFPQETWQMRAG